MCCSEPSFVPRTPRNPLSPVTWIQQRRSAKWRRTSAPQAWRRPQEGFTPGRCSAHLPDEFFERSPDRRKGVALGLQPFIFDLHLIAQGLQPADFAFRSANRRLNSGEPLGSENWRRQEDLCPPCSSVVVRLRWSEAALPIPFPSSASGRPDSSAISAEVGSVDDGMNRFGGGVV